MTKQKDIFDEVVRALPENATTEDIIKEVFVRVSALRGLKDFEEGRIKPFEEAIKEISFWN